MDIRLVVLDIDGVISEGEGQPLDLEFLNFLADLNRAARDEADCPAVTFCTGRPAPYLEVMLQAIDGDVPGVYENGAGLYLPREYRFLPHPALRGNPDLGEVRRRLEEGLVRTGEAFFQPGKEHTLTLFATDPEDTPQLRELAERALGPLVSTVRLVYSTSCLNVLPNTIDKGVGVEFLMQETGIHLESMLGVGDSGVDVAFLKTVGHSAAPSNADERIRAAVDYVSPYRTSRGVMDILRHFEVVTA